MLTWPQVLELGIDSQQPSGSGCVFKEAELIVSTCGKVVRDLVLVAALAIKWVE